MCDKANNKNTATTNSPKNPAPSVSNFSGPEIQDVESMDKALIKLV